MNVDLHDTRSSAILTALTQTRRRSGSAALGMVLTLVIDVDEGEHYDALQAAASAAREHPCRIVTVIRRPGSAAARLDAEIRVGEQSTLGEVIVLRLYGPLREQADSIVLPMLLPDAPVLVWWPGQGPAIPSEDQLGLLAQRRVTDAASARRPTTALRARVQDHSPGDTDFAWTRITPWRTLLAAALDQPFDEIIGGEVGAASNNASAELLLAWLETRLDVPFARRVTRGPGITGVRLITRRGEIAIIRPDGRLATLIRTGQPDRAVPLPRRSTEELLAEELRRLDPDEVYNETIQHLFASPADGGRRQAGAPGQAAKAATKAAKAAPKATTTKTATTGKAATATKSTPARKKAPAAKTTVARRGVSGSARTRRGREISPSGEARSGE